MSRLSDYFAFLHYTGPVADFPGTDLSLTWPLCQQRDAFQRQQRPDLWAQTVRHKGRAHGGRSGYAEGGEYYAQRMMPPRINDPLNATQGERG